MLDTVGCAGVMILDDPRATHREAVVGALVAEAAAVGLIAPDAIEGGVRAVLQREELGSTGIGRGLAFPVLRNYWTNLDRSAWLLAVCRRPVEWSALDGEPVDLVVLLCKRNNAPREHLYQGEWLANLLKVDAAADALRAAASVAEVRDLLERHAETQPLRG